MKIGGIVLPALLAAFLAGAAAVDPPEPPPEQNPWRGEEIVPAEFLQRGQERFSVGDYDAAIMYWFHASARDNSLRPQIAPLLAEAYLRRGIERYNGGYYEKSSPDFAEALKLRPGSKNMQVAWKLSEEARLRAGLTTRPNSTPNPEGPAVYIHPDMFTTPLDVITSTATAAPSPRKRGYSEVLLAIDFINLLLFLLMAVVTRRAHWFTRLSRREKAVLLIGAVIFAFLMKPLFLFLVFLVLLFRFFEWLSPVPPPQPPDPGT